ncbi:unnamed protein product [Nippostrongylus brasiliensis]|uniref:Secreted protein n=1 Tax=Nippostrongylus brasiliensis TaxID=27835 RepID=A0A0N4XNF2_NIPBR|nr:unnamed protein product [Nippostrongylus brasiliensis]
MALRVTTWLLLLCLTVMNMILIRQKTMTMRERNTYGTRIFENTRGRPSVSVSEQIQRWTIARRRFSSTNSSCLKSRLYW